MRRILTLLIVLALCCPLFSSALSVRSKEEIWNLSEQVQAMTPEAASSFISMKMKGSVAPCTVNLTAGFGIGSFIQGDWKGGLIALLGDIAASVMITTGAVRTAGIDWSLTNTGVFICKDKTQMKDLAASLTLVGVGASVLAASRVFSVVRAQLYTREFNAALVKSAGSIDILIGQNEREFLSDVPEGAVVEEE